MLDEDKLAESIEASITSTKRNGGNPSQLPSYPGELEFVAARTLGWWTPTVHEILIVQSRMIEATEPSFRSHPMVSSLRKFEPLV